MNNIIAFLIDTTIAFSLLFAGVWIVKKAFGKKLSAFMHYALWGVVILRLLLPFSLPTAINPLSLFANAGTGNAPVSGGHEKDMFGSNFSDYSETGKVQGLSNTGSDLNTYNPAPSAQNYTPSADTGLSAAADKPAQVDWASIGITGWLAGTVVMAAWLTLSSLKVRRRIAKSGTDALPATVAEAFETCKQALCIKRNIRVVIQDAMPVPAIMGALRPRLILPEDVEKSGEEELEHVVMHELTHLKRGDLAATLLLNTLNAVYWFNPLVWIAFQLIRADMETVCDNAVVKALGRGRRQMYIGTVVRFAGRHNRNRLLAALSFNDARKSMQQRIKGMFMAGKTKPRTRIAVVALALVMLAGAFMTGCQPTPEKPFVQSKGNDTVQQAINSSAPEKSAEIHKYSAPATWQGSVSDEAKKIDINVNAQVSVPTDTWGLYELVPQSADKAYIDKILTNLLGSAEIYGEDTYLSREEMQTELVRLRGQLEKAKDRKTNPKVEDEKKNPEKDDPKATQGSDVQLETVDIVAEFEKRIANIEKALVNAPEKTTTQRVPVDLNILFEENPDIPDANTDLIELGMPSVSYYKQTGEIYIHGFADTGKEKPAWVDFYKRQDGSVSIKFVNAGEGNEGGFSGREPIADEPLYKLNMTQDKAAEIARKAISDMGLGYLDIAAVHKMSIYDRSRMDGDKMPECYAFTFNRSLDGVTAAYAYRGGGFTDELNSSIDEQQYAKSWKMSEALIGVDDSGVVFAQINVPYSDVKQLAAGVELKSFDKIMEVFNQQAAIEGCFSDIGLQKLIVGRSVEVDEIKLNYMPTIWKDHPDQLIFVPVWDFFGSETTTYDKNYPDKDHSDLYASLDENYQRRSDLGEQAILTINALDGTIMQRLPGPDW